LEDPVFKKAQSSGMKKHAPLILLILILLLAAFLRLYRISDYMTFLGDEGRDVLVAKEILSGNFTLLGPRASAGDFFLGPAYYYMIAPWLWLFNYDPVGPAVMVALFGVATVGLVYFVGKRWFNVQAGLFAAALYAVSPLVITYSHSSWNPNVLPFFSLLLIYFLFKGIATANPWKYFLFTGFLLGIALQLHYLALFLILITVLYTFFAEWLLNEKIKIFTTLKHYLLLALGFLIGFAPFLAFEARHGFPNTKTIFSFIFADTLQKTYESNASFLSIIWDVFFRVFAHLTFAFPSPEKFSQYPGGILPIWGITAFLFAVAGIVWLFFYKNKFVVLLVYLWLFLGVLLFGFYKKPIHDYYFAFMFPLPFLIMGNLFSQIYQLYQEKKWHVIGIVLSLIMFFSLFLFNLSHMPFIDLQYPNKQKDQTKNIVEFVIKQTGDKPFNFALLSKSNSDHGYRYFFETLKHKPVTIENDTVDPKRKTVTEQLFVVCEDIACKPLGDPLYEVAGFGQAGIIKQWDVSVVKVYKLTHYTERKATQ